MGSRKNESDDTNKFRRNWITQRASHRLLLELIPKLSGVRTFVSSIAIGLVRYPRETGDRSLRGWRHGGVRYSLETGDRSLSPPPPLPPGVGNSFETDDELGGYVHLDPNFNEFPFLSELNRRNICLIRAE